MPPVTNKNLILHRSLTLKVHHMDTT